MFFCSFFSFIRGLLPILPCNFSSKKNFKNSFLKVPFKSNLLPETILDVEDPRFASIRNRVNKHKKSYKQNLSTQNLKIIIKKSIWILYYWRSIQILYDIGYLWSTVQKLLNLSTSCTKLYYKFLTESLRFIQMDN